MIGIIIAAIIAVWTIIIGGNPGAVGFLSATGFLWVWYWIWTIVAGIVMLLLMLGFTGTRNFLRPFPRGIRRFARTVARRRLPAENSEQTT